MSEGEPADVLLVEDNPGDVRLVREAFEESASDSRPQVVTDGTAALSFLRQQGEYADAPQPDLVLLDLNLPRTSGEDVLAALGGDPTLRRIPVVVLTSSDAREDVLSAYDRQANAYLTKPVDPEAFMQLIEQVASFWLSAAVLPPE